ncbi:related to glutathione s-transferase [Pseudozyma flocculosa]|uniref:Related to glutathione s-transferase n=1 Tax=Pseudozyma flocculosa TaxID=84751 RepID=A0A5C3F2V1_9BASI|nr:related to glutathione s-transferase [Pseudozyma flocculosa]
MQPLKYYGAGTPNGHKVSIMLEELKVLNPDFKYETIPIDIMKNTQKEDWFLRINPNGRIPALVDPNNDDFAVFESMAILLYLEKKYDDNHAFSWPSSDPKGENYRSEVLQWMSWQMAGLGPLQGQANHFRMQAVGESKNLVPYAYKRYHDETVRLYSVLESRLEGRDWLVGDGKGKYTLADMLTFPWAFWYRFAGLRNDEVGPNVKRWIQNNLDRPAVQKGLRVPTESELVKNMLSDVSTCHRRCRLRASGECELQHRARRIMAKLFSPALLNLSPPRPTLQPSQPEWMPELPSL